MRWKSNWKDEWVAECYRKSVCGHIRLCIYQAEKERMIERAREKESEIERRSKRECKRKWESKREQEGTRESKKERDSEKGREHERDNWDKFDEVLMRLDETERDDRLRSRRNWMSHSTADADVDADADVGIGFWLRERIYQTSGGRVKEPAGVINNQSTYNATNWQQVAFVTSLCCICLFMPYWDHGSGQYYIKTSGTDCPDFFIVPNHLGQLLIDKITHPFLLTD